MDRRDFMKKSAILTAGTMLLPKWLPSISAAAGEPNIVVANGPPGPAVKAAVDGLGGMGRFVRSGQRVVIKPNMSFPNPPEWGSTTHPDVVRELVSLCFNAGAASVLVLDHPLRSELCLERSGVKAACGSLPNTRVEGLTRPEMYREVQVPKGKLLKSTMVMKGVLDADVLIAAPVAKSHSASGVSLALKGMMGLVYDRKPFHMDFDLNTAVVDLCTVLVPKLTIVDASRILSDGGPSGPGKVIQLNKIVASTDMVAADAMALELGTWYGRKFKPSQVKHIKEAHERGLGNMDTASQVVKEISA
ncbi:MAG: DUF362 domain-containing protein [Desulfobacteraceae bacterium]|nr:MAG: DUF362 domain-containing protein [Desulfobacteraceae bacterium]